MLMTDTEIEAAISSGDLMIDPMHRPSLQGASYDARVGGRALVGGTEADIDVAKAGAVTIRPGEFILLVTREKFKLSQAVAGHLGMRSYYTRKGFIVLAGLQVDPGFDGHLVIGGYNASPRSLTLDYEAPFLTVEFHRLGGNAERRFPAGTEQQQGRIPRADKDYLRMMETQSLSDIDRGLSELARLVGAVQTDLRYYYLPLLFATFVAVVAFGLVKLFVR